MRVSLIALFSSILLGMLFVTTYASLDRSLWSVGAELTGDRWFQATLADAYFGFITFYAWVCYKEPTLLRRIGWFVGIMLLGNIAMSVYMLIQLGRWSPANGAKGLLLRHAQGPLSERSLS